MRKRRRRQARRVLYVGVGDRDGIVADLSMIPKHDDALNVSRHRYPSACSCAKVIFDPWASRNISSRRKLFDGECSWTYIALCYLSGLGKYPLRHDTTILDFLLSLSKGRSVGWVGLSIGQLDDMRYCYPAPYILRSHLESANVRLQSRQWHCGSSCGP
jgi:hypothetical protein